MFGIEPETITINQVYIAGVLALLVSAVSFKIKLLTLTGAAAVFMMGFIIYSAGGLMWSAPILSFFLLSSILSRINKHNNYSEKGSRRDYIQVFANGGFALLMILVGLIEKSELLYVGYVSSLSASAADTWETEIGTSSAGRTYNIVNFQPVAPGTSGGVSLAGLAGGLLGTLSIALSSLYWVDENWKLFVLIIVIAGMTGSIVDSLSGALLQRRNKCVECGQVSEKSMHCGQKTKFYKGISWINNDAVNIASSATGGIIGILLTEMF